MELQSTRAYQHVNVLASGDVVCENVKDEKKLILRAGRKLTDPRIYLLKRYQFQYIYVEQHGKKTYDVATRQFLKTFFNVVHENNKPNRYAHLLLNKEHSRIIQTLLAAYLQHDQLHDVIYELSTKCPRFHKIVDTFTLATLLAKKVDVERLGDIAVGYLFASIYSTPQRTRAHFDTHHLSHLTYLLDKYDHAPPVEAEILQLVQAYVAYTHQFPEKPLYEVYHELHERQCFRNELLFDFRQLLEGGTNVQRMPHNTEDHTVVNYHALPMRTTITLCKLGLGADTLIQLLQYFVNDQRQQAEQLATRLLEDYPTEQWMTKIALPLLQLIDAAAYPAHVYSYYTQFMHRMLHDLRNMQHRDVILLITQDKLMHPQTMLLFEGILRSCHFDVYRPPFVQSKAEIERMIAHYEAKYVITVGPYSESCYTITHYHLREAQLDHFVSRLAGETLRSFAVTEHLEHHQQKE